MLVMFAFGLIVFLGTVAMSVDVGRYVWARTQMQSAVDSAALAAAQSLPSTTGATNKAYEFYQDNAQFIISADPDAAAPIVTFPTARTVVVAGEAEIPTWFARIFGIDHWDVSAEGWGEIVVLDTMIVMDRSGSMCWDTYNNYTSRFRFDETISEGETDIQVRIDWGAGPLSNVAYVGQILRVDVSPNRIIVERDIYNSFGGDGPGSSSSISSSFRPVGRTCQQAGPTPFEPWDSVNYAASLFPEKLAAGYDRVGYVHYSTTATLHTPLSTNLAGVRASIQGAPLPTANGTSDQYTNIANGMGVANAQLVNNGSPTADFIMILVTDGVANRYCSGSDQTPNCGSTGTSSSTAESRARAQADWAAAHGIKIYTIGYGSTSNYDEDMLEYIADTTGGVYYPAPNNAAVDAAFTEIAELVRVKLTQ
jgi:hypothetical protein